MSPARPSKPEVFGPLVYADLTPGTRVQPYGMLRWEAYQEDEPAHLAEGFYELTKQFRPQSTLHWRGAVETTDDVHQAAYVVWGLFAIGLVLDLGRCNEYRIWHLPAELSRADTLRTHIREPAAPFTITSLAPRLREVQRKSVRVLCVDHEPVAYGQGALCCTRAVMIGRRGTWPHAIHAKVEDWLAKHSPTPRLVTGEHLENVLEVLTNARTLEAGKIDPDIQARWDIELNE